MMFRVILCIQFYRLTQLLLSTLLKVIIRKECQTFTNHGHAKTPPTVFNPRSLWLTLPLNMGVSHTQWPPSITRAILACLWFAQGLHKAQNKSKQQSRSIMFRVLLWIQFYRLMQLLLSTLLKGIIRKECQSFTNRGHAKTPPAVFNPLSLWLTLPRDMGSATHYCLPALLEPFLRACGLHRVCTRLKKNQNSRAVLWCSGWFHVFNFIGWRNFFFQHYLRALSAKNANHLQTTDTLKRHRRYSIRYHCGWPSLGIWGVSHTLLPPSITRAILACLWLAQGSKKSKQQSRSMMFRVILCVQFYRLVQLFFSTLLSGMTCIICD